MRCVNRGIQKPCCGHCDMLCSDIAIKVLLKVVSAFLFCIKTMQQRNLSAILNIDDFFLIEPRSSPKNDTTLCKRLRKQCGEYAYFKENVAIGHTFRSLAVCSEHHSQCLLLHLQVIGQGRKETKISLNFKY